jgi:glutamate 5-kinase
MRYYEDIFNTIGVKCAQVLLTLENLSNRKQYVRARNTFNALFDMGVVPVVNENDCVAVEELRFGDNDTLSAQVAALCEAQWLFLLTDVDGEFIFIYVWAIRMTTCFVHRALHVKPEHGPKR